MAVTLAKVAVLVGLLAELERDAVGFLPSSTPIRMSKMMPSLDCKVLPRIGRPVYASPSDEDEEDEPLSDDAFMSLIQFETRCGRLDRAEESWQQYVEQKPSASTYVKYAQWAESDANNLPLAAKVYQEMTKKLGADEMQQQWVQLEYSGFQARMAKLGQQQSQQMQQMQQMQMTQQQIQMQMAQGTQFGVTPVANPTMFQGNPVGGYPNNPNGAPFSQKKRYIMKPPFGPPQRWLEQQFEAEELEEEELNSPYSIEPMGPVFGEKPYQPPNFSRPSPSNGQAMTGFGGVGMRTTGTSPLTMGTNGMNPAMMGTNGLNPAMMGVNGVNPGIMGQTMQQFGMPQTGQTMGNTMQGAMMGGTPQMGGIGAPNMGVPGSGLGFGEAMPRTGESGEGSYKVDADDPNWSKAEFGTESTYKPMSKQYDGHDFTYSDNFERPMVTDETGQTAASNNSPTSPKSSDSSPPPSSWATKDSTIGGSTMSSTMNDVGEVQSQTRVGETSSSSAKGFEPDWVSRGSLFQSEIESQRKKPKSEAKMERVGKGLKDPTEHATRTLVNGQAGSPDGAANKKEAIERKNDENTTSSDAKDDETKAGLISNMERLNSEIESMRKALATAESNLMEMNAELQAIEEAKTDSEDNKERKNTSSKRKGKNKTSRKTQKNQA
mmetsp:Transcript_4239/g.11537  ORF Transcript_4239/g.11537 Transcript_4239/m.11537 type:complete len:662 (-) Transcript_4239:200-2185(-)